MKALAFSKVGDAEVLEYIDVPVPALMNNEVLVQMRAIGLNHIDVYRRKGNYPLVGEPPFIAGLEGAGQVVASKSSLYKAGDMVAFTDVPFSNAEYVVVPESQAIPLVAPIDYAMAATVLLQGLTAHYLATDSHLVREGETVLVLAAASGVGQMLTQICKMKGAKVVGLTRDPAKVEGIKEQGADHALVLDGGWKEAIMDITRNQGVDVAYDSVGSTLKATVEVTRDHGHVVYYGVSGGKPEPIDPSALIDTGKTLTGGNLWGYLTSGEERIRRAKLLFDWVANGYLKVRKPLVFKLSEGQTAHEYLENGRNHGKILLVPDSVEAT